MRRSTLGLLALLAFACAPVAQGQVAAGSFTITIGNVSAGSLSQAVVLNFMVFKGVTS